jgi:hypothetical protein
MEYNIQIIIINELGEFRSNIMIVNQEQYTEVVERSKTFYLSGFEFICDDNSFTIIPPDVIRKSILKIKIIDGE